MNIKLDKKNPTFGSLNIALEESDYKPRVDNRLQEYQRTAEIKGFRKGKVPTGVIKQMVGEGVIAEEVFKMVSEEINKYIKENELNIIGEPLPAKEEDTKQIDWKKQKEFDFTYELGIVPEFSVELSDKLKFTRSTIKVDKTLMDETLDNITKQYGESKDVEVAGEDDFINGSFRKADEEEGKSTLIPVSKVQKKEKSKFLGAKAGDSIQFKLKKAFDEDFILYLMNISPEELKKTDGEYVVEVEKVTHQTPAEINQDLFDKLFGPDNIKSEEEFMDKVKESINGNYAKDSDALLYYDIQEKLLSKAKVNLSPEFLKRWIVEANKGEISSEDVEKEYDKYERELKWTLIKNKISVDHNVKVEDAEVRERAMSNIAQQYFGGMQMTPEMEGPLQNFVENYLKENNGNNYYNTYEQVMSDKLFEFFKGKVTVKDKEVSIDEFKKIVKKK